MKATFKITIEAPCECTKEEFKQWIDFELGVIKEMPDNELSQNTIGMDNLVEAMELISIEE